MENSFNGIEKIHQYCIERAFELQQLASLGNPWVFLCCASFIDFLNKMIHNSNKAGRSKYIEFIKKYIGEVDERYKSFQYSSGKCDLATQMYFVFRNGIVHTFSLFPDEDGIKEEARSRSILLGHEKNNDIHFDHKTQNGFDSVVFTAESLSKDLQKTVEIIFKDKQLHLNILDWCSKYPPISTLSI